MKGKQIKAILNNDEDLRLFVTSFYDRLMKANPDRETFPRDLPDRRLDAMARLLVGDEVCSALAFDGERLLIATNNNGHSQDRIQYKISYLVKADRNQEDSYEFYPVLYLSYNNSSAIKFQKDVPLKYNYISDTNSFALASNSIIKFDLAPEEHQIPFFAALPVGITIDVKCDIPTNHIFKNPYSDFKKYMHGKDSHEFPPLSMEVAENALIRRSETLIQHAGAAALWGQQQETMTPEQLQQYNDVIDKHRKDVLMQSLAWEISKWYSKDYEYQDFSEYKRDPKKDELYRFMEILNEDFNLYKKQHNDLVDRKLAENWFNDIKHRIVSDTITAPSYVKDKINSFHGEQYFTDLAKLEDFFITEGKNNTQLAGLFIQYGNPHNIDRKTFIQVIDDLEDGVHAEIRILHHFLQKNKIPEYIAVALLCCPLCKLVMDAEKIEEIPGIHATAFPKWVFPDALKNNVTFLKNFFGEELHKEFERLKDVDKKNAAQKTEKASKLIFEIIESIGTLEDKFLKELNPAFKKLFVPGAGYEVNKADESDDEDGKEDLVPNQDSISIEEYDAMGKDANIFKGENEVA